MTLCKARMIELDQTFTTRSRAARMCRCSSTGVAQAHLRQQLVEPKGGDKAAGSAGRQSSARDHQAGAAAVVRRGRAGGSHRHRDHRREGHRRRRAPPDAAHRVLHDAAGVGLGPKQLAPPACASNGAPSPSTAWSRAWRNRSSSSRRRQAAARDDHAHAVGAEDPAARRVQGRRQTCPRARATHRSGRKAGRQPAGHGRRQRQGRLAGHRLGHGIEDPLRMSPGAFVDIHASVGGSPAPASGARSAPPSVLPRRRLRWPERIAGRQRQRVPVSRMNKCGPHASLPPRGCFLPRGGPSSKRRSPCLW